MIGGPALPSKTQINKAGQRLAEAHGSIPTDTEGLQALEEAFDIVTQFRAAHSYPLSKVVNGLRSMVKSEGCDIVVSQRLKRLPRIVRKLHRMRNSSLARLEDIGGCRAVLADGPELIGVEQRLRARWGSQIVRDRDYINDPKDIGYRAVHLVVERDERRIEVQLRTRGQQQWAEAIEGIDSQHGLNMKDGEGPPELMRFFKAAGDMIHAMEYRLNVSSELSDEYEGARQAVVNAGYYRA